MDRAAVVSAPNGVSLRQVLVLLLVIAAFSDVPSLVKLGPVSGMGALTIVELAVVIAAVRACRTYPERLVYSIAPYGVFLVWVTLSALWARNTVAGFQNLIVYVLFGVTVLLSGALAARIPDLTAATIERAMRWVDVIALTFAALCLVFQGLPSDSTPWLMAARSFALLGLLPLSWHVAHGHAGSRRSMLLAWLWLLMIGLSMSRMATAVGLVYMGVALVLQMRWNTRALFLRAPAIAAATAVVVLVLARETPMADRLFTGDTSIEIGNVAVNASGRTAIWDEVIYSALQAPIVGHGLGSSMGTASRVKGVGHPHNDYLRVWHDQGFIGLGLWFLAFGTLLAVLCREVWRSRRCDDPAAPMPLAALLGLAGVLITCATDNAIIYPFVMVPLGVLVGAGLGARPYAAAVARARRG